MVEDRSADLQMLPFTEESLLTENEEEEIGEETFQLQQRKKPVFAKKRKRGLNNNDEMLQKAVSYLGTASEHISKRREGNLMRKKYFPDILQMSYGKYQMGILNVWQGTK